VESIGVGVIGLGRIGWMHAQNVAWRIRGVRLAAACDAVEEVRDRARAELYVPCFERVEELVERSDVDAVLIASTAETHAAMIETAVKAGKHVFSEKPIGLTLEQTDPVLQRVLDSGLRFQIGFQRRWDASFLEARRRIQAGEIGRPIVFTAHGRDPRFTGAFQDPAKSGGIFLDAAIHDYDAARFLLGREVVRVCAQGATLVHHHLTPLGDVDTCATVLTFDDGALGIVEWNRCSAYGYDVRAEVQGTEGALQIGSLRRHDVMRLDARGVLHDTPPWFAERFGDAYRAQIEGFATAIRDGTFATPGVEDARRSLLVALTARESAQRGVPVAVPELPPLHADA
jgi:inositol 2-dehydrogenase